MIRFTAPIFLVLLPAVVWFWRAAPPLSSRRRWIRCGAVLALILAVAGLEARSGDSVLSVMFAVDYSGSMAAIRGSTTDNLHAMSAAAREGDRAGVLFFASTPAVERALQQTRSGPALPTQPTAPIGTGTNIEAALRVARAGLPPSGERRVVLLSDGQETEGDSLAEASRFAQAGVPIDVLIPSESTAPSIEILRVTAPATARRNEPFTVIVSAHGDAGTQGKVTLMGAGEAPRIAPITLSSDGFGTAAFLVRAAEAGVKSYEATVEDTHPADEFIAEPRRSGAVVTVGGDGRVLYVGTRADVLRPSLTALGFELRQTDAGSFPRVAAALADYDAVVLDDVRADTIDVAQADALRLHVERQGGGLLFLGGRESLDPGLLSNHPLAELLPVDVRPRGGQRAPSLGVIVAFDKSGSMDDRVDGVPRIEFARLAVRRVLDAVPPTDAVGVIAFDSDAQVVAPLAAGHNADVLAESLRTVQPSGSTAIAPALELAQSWFVKAASGLARRHVLLISDGHTSADDIERIRGIVAERPFELSVVALGVEADRQLLQALAHSSGGRAYFPNDIRELPAIVARESTRVAGGRVVESRFQPVARPHPIVTALAGATLPALGGYVVTAAKPTADSPLQSPLEDPVMATWRYGAGHVAVYTAEIHADWSAPLRNWEGFRALLGGTLQWTARRLRDDALYASFREDARGLVLTVDAFHADQPVNELQVRAIVRGPEDDAETITLAATVPGRYQARMQPAEPGIYVATIVSERSGASARTTRGTYWSADYEYRHRVADESRLTEIARISGGRVLAAGESPFGSARQPQFAAWWPWLALLALALFLAELLIALRPNARTTTFTSPDTTSRAKAAA
jgi:Ca-activated chloride channel family protein